MCSLSVGVSVALIDRPVATWVHEHLGYQWHSWFAANFHGHLLRLGPFSLMAGPSEALRPLSALVFVVLAIGTSAGWRPRIRGRIALALCLSVFASVMISGIAKEAFGRTWPESWLGGNPSWIRDGVYGFFPFHGGDGWGSFPNPIDAGAADAEPLGDGAGPESLGLERGDGSRRDRRGTALIDARLLSGGNALQLALAAHVRLKLGEHAQHPEERLARLRSLAQWGLLRMGEEPGSLIGPPRRVHSNDQVAQFLLHSVVLGHGRGLPYPQLVDHPALFPFQVDVPVRDLTRNSVFRVQRQGDQSDFVELASVPSDTSGSEGAWPKGARKIA